MILITGATGTNGIEVAKLLSGTGQTFRAMVRSRESAGALTDLPGAELVEADFDDRNSLIAALEGVSRAFLLPPSTEKTEDQQLRFVDAAKAAGVRLIVKLSQFHAHRTSPVRFLRYYAAVEDAVRASGMAWTFLRPNLFMQGFLHFAQNIARDGRFFATAGNARISVVDVRDNAAAAVAALTGSGNAGQIYDLTDPEALTHAEMAERLSAATGQPVSYVDVPENQFREMLAALGTGAWQADGLVEDYAHYRRGEASSVAPGVKDATGQLRTLSRRFSQA